jgi:hypothetical protein
LAAAVKDIFSALEDIIMLLPPVFGLKDDKHF